MIIKFKIKTKRIKNWTFRIWSISYDKTLAMGKNVNKKISNDNIKFCRKMKIYIGFIFTWK